MIIQYSPWGHCVNVVSERTWTTGNVTFDSQGIASDGEHDDHGNYQPYVATNSGVFQDEERNELLEDFLRPVEVEGLDYYSDSVDVTVPSWPQYWCAKVNRAMLLADACQSFTEALQYAPRDYFDDAALKVLEIFGHGRMLAELKSLKTEIAEWRLTDEAKALDEVVCDDPET